MKCFVKSLLGNESNDQEDKEMCQPFHPIVKSLIFTTIFFSFMSIVMVVFDI